MRYVLISVALVFALACAGSLLAADTTPAPAKTDATTASVQDDIVIPPQLSVSGAIALAMEDNAMLKQSMEATKTSLAGVRIAGYSRAVALNSVASLDRSGGSSDLNSLMTASYGFENLVGTTATLNLSPLGLGTKRGGLGLVVSHPLRKGSGLLSSKGSALMSAKSDYTISEKQLFLSRQSTVQGVIEAYYRAVLEREKVKVQEQAVTNAEDAAKGWKRREEEGMAAGIDVSRSDILVQQTKDQLNMQQRSARNALDQLMISIGGGIGQTPELTDSVPDTPLEIPALRDAVDKALQNRVELSVYDERLAEQRRQLALAADQMRPEVNLVAGFNGSHDRQGVIGTSLFNSGALSAGFEYVMPLDQNIIQERRGVAERNLDVLRNLRLFQMEQITEQVRTAYRSVEAAKASLEILAQKKIIADRNLNFAQRMMEEGEGSSRDLMDAQQAITEVDSSLLSAKANLYLASVDLRRAMGDDLTNTMGTK